MSPVLALVDCPSCGQPVDKNAASCPRCGRRRPGGPDRRVRLTIIAVLAAAVVAGTIAASVHASHSADHHARCHAAELAGEHPHGC